MTTSATYLHDDDDLPVLTFSLNDQLYALAIKEVIEVASMVELLKITAAQPAVLGMANRHGQPVPMIDLRQIMGIDDAEFSVDTSTLFIVVRFHEQLFALVVGEIYQVEYIPKGQLDTSTTSANYIRGIIGQRERLIQMIDLKTVLSSYLTLER